MILCIRKRTFFEISASSRDRTENWKLDFFFSPDGMKTVAKLKVIIFIREQKPHQNRNILFQLSCNDNQNEIYYGAVYRASFLWKCKFLARISAWHDNDKIKTNFDTLGLCICNVILLEGRGRLALHTVRCH